MQLENKNTIEQSINLGVYLLRIFEGKNLNVVS
jgi:hypothetical protein